MRPPEAPEADADPGELATARRQLDELITHLETLGDRPVNTLMITDAWTGREAAEWFAEFRQKLEAALAAGPIDVRIGPADHRDPEIAQRIHAVQMAAYAQEAQWLQVLRFAPLERTAEDIQRSAEQFIVAREGKDLVGAVSVEFVEAAHDGHGEHPRAELGANGNTVMHPRAEPGANGNTVMHPRAEPGANGAANDGLADHQQGAVHIATLVVMPEWQCMGIGWKLVEAVIAAHGPSPITVSTGVKNHPALWLYAKFGFVQGPRRLAGEGPYQVEVVLLRRPAT